MRAIPIKYSITDAVMSGKNNSKWKLRGAAVGSAPDRFTSSTRRHFCARRSRCRRIPPRAVRRKNNPPDASWQKLINIAACKKESNFINMPQNFKGVARHGGMIGDPLAPKTPPKRDALPPMRVSFSLDREPFNG